MAPEAPCGVPQSTSRDDWGLRPEGTKWGAEVNSPGRFGLEARSCVEQRSQCRELFSAGSVIIRIIRSIRGPSASSILPRFILRYLCFLLLIHFQRVSLRQNPPAHFIRPRIQVWGLFRAPTDNNR